MNTTFQDPFAGTPKAATCREIGVDNASPLEKARRGTVFEEGGLFGMKDIDDSILYPAEYTFIGKCQDHILFLKPNGDYLKLSPGCSESGYMQEEDRPYVEHGKAGFKKDGKVIVPAEYDFVEPTFYDNYTVFTVVKDGREYYINDEGKEVLTRVRRFEGENCTHSPFWHGSWEFDYFTVLNYVGHKDENNPNVVQMYGQWIELDRYCRDEVMEMLINPDDDLPLTEKDTDLLCNDFSYEYAYYFANASGEHPLAQCIDQLESMRAFSNSWYFVTKIWQAPGEHLEASELREFERRLHEGHQVIGTPLYAVGHSDTLKSGEVKVLFITHYNERCWPADFEFEWSDKCRKLPITELKKHVPALRRTIEKEAMKKYVEEVFQDQIGDLIINMEHYDGMEWDETRKALDYFLKKGSMIDKALFTYTVNAYLAAKKRKPAMAEFYIKAALWALEKGSIINYGSNSKSVLDFVQKTQGERLNNGLRTLVDNLHEKLLASGAKTFKELEAERQTNTDYWKELGYLVGSKQSGMGHRNEVVCLN